MMVIMLRIITKSEKEDKLKKLQLCSTVYQKVFYDKKKQFFFFMIIIV